MDSCLLILALASFGFSECAIVPNELPTLLSIIYSNIPPIHLGIDTRLGLGFRLGPHSDFQTLIEIGPQQKTGPLAPNTDAKRRRAPQNNRKGSEYQAASTKSNQNHTKLQPPDQIQKNDTNFTTIAPQKAKPSKINKESTPKIVKSKQKSNEATYQNTRQDTKEAVPIENLGKEVRPEEGSFQREWRHQDEIKFNRVAGVDFVPKQKPKKKLRVDDEPTRFVLST